MRRGALAETLHVFGSGAFFRSNRDGTVSLDIVLSCQSGPPWRTRELGCGDDRHLALADAKDRQDIKPELFPQSPSGYARARALSPERRKEISRLGVEARLRNRRTSMTTSSYDLCGAKNCAGLMCSRPAGHRGDHWDRASYSVWSDTEVSSAKTEQALRNDPMER